MIEIYCNNEKVKLEFIRFSDGASNLKIVDPDKLLLDSSKSPIYVNVLLTSNVDSVLWDLALVFDALNDLRVVDSEVVLNLPYLPHGRADRVFEKGNAFPLRIFLSAIYRMINMSGFDTRVMLTDPHSDYVKDYAGLRLKIKTQEECFTEIAHWIDIRTADRVYIVSPDAGSKLKVSGLVTKLNTNDFSGVSGVYCSKTRDVSTGKIVGFDVPPVVSCDRAIIVDDICDGGGTFIPIATKLKERGVKRVDLYVTHGIFSKGLQLFRPYIDNIYAYQTVGTYINHKDLLDYNSGVEVKG